MRVYVYPSVYILAAACGPTGTKFGAHMQSHLEVAVGYIKNFPV